MVENKLTYKLMIDTHTHTHHVQNTVLSKVDDFATFKKVEVHAENSTF